MLSDLIGCTISVRDPAIFTSCMDCGCVLRVVRFVMKCKSGTTFLEIRSDLASTSSANFECKWNFMPKLTVSYPDPYGQPCSIVCLYFAVTDEFNVHLTRVLIVVKQECSVVDYFYLTIKLSS